jgi:hypothetical protein
MEFISFKLMIQDHFKEMITDASTLFEVDIDKDKLWALYLDSIPTEFNPVYREKKEMDCSACRHFMRDIGNMVVIKNNKMILNQLIKEMKIKFPEIRKISLFTIEMYHKLLYFVED